MDETSATRLVDSESFDGEDFGERRSDPSFFTRLLVKRNLSTI